MRKNIFREFGKRREKQNQMHNQNYSAFSSTVIDLVNVNNRQIHGRLDDEGIFAYFICTFYISNNATEK